MAGGPGHPDLRPPCVRHPPGAHRGPHLPELGRGGGDPRRNPHPGIHLQHPRRHQKGRSPHAGSGERHRTGDEVRTPGPGRHHPPGQTQLRRGRVHLQPPWVHGAQLFGLRRLRDLTGRNVQRHPDDPQRHHRCSRRRRGRGDSQALAFSGILRSGCTFRAVRTGKTGATRPPAPSMRKETGWFSAKAGA